MSAIDDLAGMAWDCVDGTLVRDVDLGEAKIVDLRPVPTAHLNAGAWVVLRPAGDLVASIDALGRMGADRVLTDRLVTATTETEEEAWVRRAMDKAERAAITSQGLGSTPPPDPVQPYAEREDVQRAVGKAMGQ